MSKNIFSFSVLMLLFFLTPGCSSTDNNRSHTTASLRTPPDWISGNSHNRFPEPFYLTGTGLSSLSRQKADDMARQELAKQIRVRVNGMDEVVVSEKKEVKKGVSISTAYSDVSSGIRVSVGMELEGVRVAERWFDPERKEYYSFAVLNREEAASALTRKIKKASERADYFYRQGLSNLDDKKYIPALRSFLKGDLEIHNAGQDILARRVVAGEFTVDDVKTPEKKLKEAVTGIISKIGIRDLRAGTDNSRSDTAGGFSDVFEVFYQNGKVKEPVSDSPMLVLLDNEVALKRRTGEDGLLRLNFSSQEKRSYTPGVIEVSFDIESLLKGFPQNHNTPWIDGLSDIRGYFSSSPGSPAIPVLDINTAFTSLVSGLVSNLDLRSDLSEIRCTVGDFIEITSGNRLTFSRLIENELRTALALSTRIPFRVIDKEMSDTLPVSRKERAALAPYFVTGGYILTENVVKINAKLVEVSTNLIVSATYIQLDRGEVSEADFIVSGVNYPEAAFPDTINALFLKKRANNAFNIKIWTDKRVYTEGEPVIFRFTTDRDCYLTILDLGTSGNISYLFPNEFHRDSFIRKGRVYSIPGEEYGFSIKADGPPGVERVKAIASVYPLKINRLNSGEGFFSITPEDGKTARDLHVEVKGLTNTDRVEAYHEFFIRAPKGLRYRGLTKETLPKPEKPIDIIGTQGVREETEQ